MKVTYTRGFKMPGAEDFSSEMIELTVEDEVAAGETLEQTHERLRAFVVQRCELERERLGAASPPPGYVPQASAPRGLPVRGQEVDVFRDADEQWETIVREFRQLGVDRRITDNERGIFAKKCRGKTMSTILRDVVPRELDYFLGSRFDDRRPRDGGSRYGGRR